MSAYVFENMLGRVIKSVTGAEEGSESMELLADDGAKFTFVYEPDCCASCSIESIDGDISDLVGHPLLQAEKVSSEDTPDLDPPDGYEESYTWSFYKFATIKGSVTIRWFGSSNGYYGEVVKALRPQEVTYQEDIGGKHSQVYGWEQEVKP